MSRSLAQYVARFRKLEFAGQLTPFRKSIDAKNVLAMWPQVRKEWKRPKSKPPKDDADLWIWLWRGMRYDLTSLAESARMTEHDAAATMRYLVTARVVYPDGSISRAAEVLVSGGEAIHESGKKKAWTMARDVECPHCGALPGDRCITATGALCTTNYAHADRIRLATREQQKSE